MAKHDELLDQEPRYAPEPETAEERSKRVGWGAAGGGLLAGLAAALKFGGLSKLFVWLFAFHAFNLWRLGGWIALVLVITAIAALLVVQSRKEA
jgi:predicted lipid-binding transport protein (Tim44 family)